MLFEDLGLEDPVDFALKRKALNRENPELPEVEKNRQTGRTTEMLLQVYQSVQGGKVTTVRAHSVMFAETLQRRVTENLKQLGIPAEIKRNSRMLQITPRETVDFVDHLARGEL